MCISVRCSVFSLRFEHLQVSSRDLVFMNTLLKDLTPTVFAFVFMAVFEYTPGMFSTGEQVSDQLEVP